MGNILDRVRVRVFGTDYLDQEAAPATLRSGTLANSQFYLFLFAVPKGSMHETGEREEIAIAAKRPDRPTDASRLAIAQMEWQS